MNDPLASWLRARPKPRASICDIDTLCTGCDCPLPAAVAVLAALERSIEVHYVTSRPEASQAATEHFLVEQRLPGWRNLHFCASWQSSRAHKAEVIARLARQYRVLVSSGEHAEEEEASRAARVPFVRVRGDNDEGAWRQV